jgi:hypothetical protein
MYFRRACLYIVSYQLQIEASQHYVNAYLITTTKYR